jgi:hypothetical protein
MNTTNIGVVGYSSGKFNEKQARLLVELTLSYVVSQRPGSKIVSGLTDLGIPKLAYEFAQRNGLETVGVACSKAEEYDCFPVDEKIIVGDEWGDESNTFLTMCDVLIRVGGGKQSLEEVETFRTMKPLAVVIELELAREA